MTRASNPPCGRSWIGRCLGLLTILGVLGTWPTSPPSGEARAGEKVTLGVAATDVSKAGVFLAKETGLFEQQGLDVDFVFFDNSIEALQTMVRGRLSVALASGTGVVNAVAGGVELAWIAGLVDTVPYVLVVSPDITQAADLKGKRFGINRFGTADEFAARFTVGRLGLDPRADVTFVQIGQQATRLAALKAQTIQAALFAPPGTVIARKLGFRELTSVASLGLRYPFEALVSTRQFIRERPDVLRRLLTGIVMGNRAFKTRRDDGIAVIRKYLKIDDGEALAEAYAVFAPLIQDKPYVSLEGVQLMLDELGRGNARIRAMKPSDLVEMQFIREMDDRGFLDR